ncbi:unnamed protein product [Adineta ricciae]|uniref:Serine/threonine-protein phosphatase n=1 Tax=Adineta ricciae TaxID=249248 RepID=A0A814RQH5_ADIRI|nr:unnamed protein product [Adineta ricciae]
MKPITHIVPQVAALSDRADKMKMVSKLSTLSIDKSASKIQQAFRKHQARLKLKKQAAWQIHEKLEYSSEQTEAKLKDMFEKLIKASGTLSPSVTKLLHKAGLPVEEKELLRLTNPENIRVEPTYRGPRIEGPITRKVFVDLIEAFQRGQVLHEKYVCEILHQARTILKTIPNFNHVDLSNLRHVFIVGDLHGQLADLLHIFNSNGLPSTDNAYIFNGDFVDRGRNSVEVILLLMVALILYPSSVFLNRGNHEDIMVTVRYGFHNEINHKYRTRKAPLVDLFKDIFSWLPLYSYVDAGKNKIIVMHGGISDKINLKRLNSLARNRYVSIEVPPESKSGGKRLTEEEENEYHQIQDLFWSDPDPRGRRGCRKNDDRKMACFFGADVTQQFLKKYNLSMIIRSHQVKQDGYEYNHGGKVLTVFSASNYCGGSNWGAVVRWDYNEEEPWIISFKTQGVEMEKMSFSKQVTLFEDPAYHSLMEKVMTNKTALLKEFIKADTKKDDHLPLTTWADIMSDVLQVDLPWLILRAKLVQEDADGVLYRSMFDDYILDNPKFQMSNTGIMEDLYMWKDMLLALFNLIDYNHSGFISRNEFADVIKLILYGENGSGDVNDAYVEELTSAMDFDKNGKIDFNEFLESFRIVNVKKPQQINEKSKSRKKSGSINGVIVEHKQAQCAYIVLLLTIYWVTEVVPYGVTSLLPLALFPMLNILPGEVVGHSYFKDITTLFLGSMTLAHAMEYIHLHRRLALFVLSFVGSSIRWSMAGLMCVTSFISMWINNSAAASIMMPVAIAIVDQLENYDMKISENVQEMVPIDIEPAFDVKTIGEDDNDPKRTSHHTTMNENVQRLVPLNDLTKRNKQSTFDYSKLRCGFLIAVAYSSGIGGLTTLVGTGPNIFVKGFVDQMYENDQKLKFEISFGNFFLYALPMGFLMLIFCWFTLQILYNRKDFFRWTKTKKELEREQHLHSILKQQYKDLNVLSWQDMIIGCLFAVLILLWIIRDFSEERWLFIFTKEYATDGTIALFIGSLPLFLPDKNPFQNEWTYKPILPWNHLSKTFPWGVFMLQGAGLAIADGFKTSDLSSTMATFLQFIVGAPNIVIILFVIIISAIFTEFTSNLACASILFPILHSIATIANIHPAYLIMPSCIAVSLSFMLPIATPPNAMILSNESVKVMDLIQAGISIKLFSIVVIFIQSAFALSYIFDIDDMIPLSTNGTLN